MDEETYKAKSNGLTPEENEQIQKSEDERSTENNANNLRNAANVAMQTKIPHAVAAGAIVKGADKLTGGKSSEAAGKIITKINKRMKITPKIPNPVLKKSICFSYFFISALRQDVPGHGTVEQLPNPLKFLGLAQDPHELAHCRLGGHIKGLQQAQGTL